MEESRKAWGRKRVPIGARGGTRTPDAHLRTVALYPLSYTGRSDKYGSWHHASTACAGGRAVRRLNLLMMYVHIERTYCIPMVLHATTHALRIAQLSYTPPDEQTRDFEQPNCRCPCLMVSSTDAGSSAARLARSVRDAEVGGSNPLSPTSPGVAPRRSRSYFGFFSNAAL